MGILGMLRRNPKGRSVKASIAMAYAQPDGRVVDVGSDVYRAMQAEAEKRRGEEQRQRVALQRMNRAFLEEHGVDVGRFTSEKAIADALAIIGEVCPPMTRFDHGIRGEAPFIEFNSPTGTGKVPKNVVTARLTHEDIREVPTGTRGITCPEYGDSLVVALHYLSNGSVNKADVSASHSGISISLAIRRVSDILRITGGRVILIKTGETRPLFHGGVPEVRGEAIEALEREVSALFHERRRALGIG